MQLQNIYNKNREIYLFQRNDSGEQIITTDNTYYPYYYQENPQGEYLSYTGKRLKKFVLPHPKDMKLMRNSSNWGTDIPYPKMYLLDRVPEISPGLISYCFLDIEILCTEFPEWKEAKFPISCITVYSNLNDQYYTWFLGDWNENEELMLEDFISIIKQISPDILSSWNGDSFDYPYLFSRIKKVLDKDFSKEISPIGESRFGRIMDIWYPAGISILDYMEMFKKYTLNKKPAYNLDFTLENEFGKGKEYSNVNFSVLSNEVKLRNIGDVSGMLQIEEKYKLIPYFNDIRRKTKCLWEDLPSVTMRELGKVNWISNNSRVVDMLILQEAKQKNIVLPNKNPTHDTESSLQGAFREAFKTGVFHGKVFKLDLSSAYPMSIINFCLDSSNIVSEPTENTKTVTVIDRLTDAPIGTFHFLQNEDAIIPTTVKKLLSLKDKIKKELNSYQTGTKEYHDAEIAYASIKSLANSAFGVISLPSFRLFDIRIASCITFLVRDLIKYTKIEAEKIGIEIIYADTDSVFCQSKHDYSHSEIEQIMNNFIEKWAKERYNTSVGIRFENEGYFSDLLILGKCRYRGNLVGKKGNKQEDKGIEVKRGDSSKFLAKFQDEMLNKILSGMNEETLLLWIKQQKEYIKTLTLKEIGFPVKMNQSEYKTKQIRVRAMENTKIINPKFNLFPGERFWYVYVLSATKDSNVLAFSEKYYEHIDLKLIDWKKMIERNISNKVEKLFEALSWDYRNNGQLELIF